MKYAGWRVAGYDRPTAVTLVRAGASPLVATLLASRGAVGPSELERLERIGTDDIPDPMLMKDMDKAAARLKSAIERREKIAVFGDYDVDGITASCVISQYLLSKGLGCELIIPERREEGYGLSKSALDEMKAHGVTLAVTVDCGITSAAEAGYARSLGLDLVITDHHECGPELPEAVAVVDPKRHDSEYPESSLAGVGVAFSLVEACEGTDKLDGLLEEYGDLVALGTIADVMPVTGVNRILIKRGLELMRRCARPGIRMLAEASGTDISKISVTGVGFALAPRLNAAGRMGQTSLAVRLMLSDSDEKAMEYAARLCVLNRERQRIESEMFEEALKMAKALPPSGAPLVLASESWYLGVAGIVASRLAERLSRPAIVICIADGVGRGSCRSVSGFSIHAALESRRDMLITFGGHEMAAGLTIEREKIPELARSLQEADAGEYAGAMLDVDFEVIKPGLLTPENVASLETLEPYGNGNPPPMLCMRGARIESASPICSGKHSRFRIHKNGESFDGVFFGRTLTEIGLRPGDAADIAFTPQINEYRGRRSVQMYLTDMHAPAEV